VAARRLVLEELLDAGQHLHLRPVRADAIERAHEPVGRRVADGPRAVAGRAGGAQLQPEGPLLRRLDAEVQRPARGVSEVLPALGQEELGVLQPVAPPFGADRPQRAREVGFLVGGGEEEDVAVEADRFALQPKQGQELQDALRLHVLGAAAVDEPVLQQAGERRHRPARGVGRHDVHVVGEDQRPPGAAALERREQVRAPGRELVHHHGDAFVLEDRLVEQRGLQLAARRVRGVDLEVLAEKADGQVVPGGRLLRASDGGGEQAEGQRRDGEQSHRAREHSKRGRV
jgi:hypothetical protein